MKKYISLLLFILTVWVLPGYGGEVPLSIRENYRIIKNLEEERLKIDENNRYVPFIGEDYDAAPAVGIILNLARYSGNSLLCCVPARSSVLIGQQMVGYYEKKTCVRFDIDSLQQAHEKEHVLVSVYQPHKAFNDLHFLVVKNHDRTGVGASNIPYKRESSALEDFFIVGLLLLLVSYAFQINRFPRTFRNLYDFRKVFSFKIREDSSKIKLLDEAHIFFLIHHCLLTAYLLVLLMSTNSLVDLSLITDQPQTFTEFVVTCLQLSLYVFFVIWLKYVLVMLFGALFGLRNLRYIHVFDFMRMSLIFWSLIFTAMVLTYAGIIVTNPFYVNLLVYVFIAFAIARIIILCYRLFNGAAFRNMYLFSYICTLEVIPLLVGFELFIN